MSLPEKAYDLYPIFADDCGSYLSTYYTNAEATNPDVSKRIDQLSRLTSDIEMAFNQLFVEIQQAISLTQLIDENIDIADDSNQTETLLAVNDARNQRLKDYLKHVVSLFKTFKTYADFTKTRSLRK